jgi:hypothetical protein
MGKSSRVYPEKSRPLRRLRNPESMDDALPLDFWFPEIDQEADGPAGGSQIIETLRGMFVGKAIHTFRLNHQHVFDEDIRKVFSDGVTLVSYCK